MQIETANVGNGSNSFDYLKNPEFFPRNRSVSSVAPAYNDAVTPVFSKQLPNKTVGVTTAKVNCRKGTIETEV